MVRFPTLKVSDKRPLIQRFRVILKHLLENINFWHVLGPLHFIWWIEAKYKPNTDQESSRGFLWWTFWTFYSQCFCRKRIVTDDAGNNVLADGTVAQKPPHRPDDENFFAFISKSNYYRIVMLMFNWYTNTKRLSLKSPRKNQMMIISLHLSQKKKCSLFIESHGKESGVKEMFWQMDCRSKAPT